MTDDARIQDALDRVIAGIEELKAQLAQLAEDLNARIDEIQAERA